MASHAQPVSGVANWRAMDDAQRLAAGQPRNPWRHQHETSCRIVAVVVAVVGIVGMVVVGGLVKRMPLAACAGSLAGSGVLTVGGVVMLYAPFPLRQPPHDPSFDMTYGAPPPHAFRWLGTARGPLRDESLIRTALLDETGFRVSGPIRSGQRYQALLKEFQSSVTIAVARAALQAFQTDAGPGSELNILSTDPKVMAAFIQAAYELGVGSGQLAGITQREDHDARKIWLYTDDTMDLSTRRPQLPTHLRFYKTCPGTRAVSVTSQWMAQWKELAARVSVAPDPRLPDSPVLKPPTPEEPPDEEERVLSAETPTHVI